MDKKPITSIEETKSTLLEEQKKPPSKVEYAETFEDLCLKKELLRGIYEYECNKLTSSQKQVLPSLLNKHDIFLEGSIEIENTVTGIIGALQLIDPEKLELQGIVFCPTREKAHSTAKIASDLGAFTNTKITVLVGGIAIKDEIAKVKAEMPQLIIGTPGRLFDFIKKGIVTLDALSLLIFDEADELISRGFGEMIKGALGLVPASVQKCVFSAIFPEEILDFFKPYMKDSCFYKERTFSLTLCRIRQYYVEISNEEDNIEVLYDLLSNIEITRVAIYANTREKVERIAQCICGHGGFPDVSVIYSGMLFHELCKEKSKFSSGAARIIILTDGEVSKEELCDIPLIINYNMPRDKDMYLQRGGQGGEFGRKGVMISFISQNSAKMIKELEKWYQTVIDPLPADLSDLL
eukprot:TRINITY_DN584_c0_g1_i3.p1 TRINITY_DN584_c0_g1~~TRINITY_DN584_c0_g1_i3.p1  ORF type:complete len:408 (-),score=51.41 TRINITY_DN584_c0_g1_i3:94-1317(-)